MTFGPSFFLLLALAIGPLLQSYTLEGGKVQFGQMGGTLMACTDAIRDRAFQAALGEAATWRVLGSHLELRNDKDALLARFEAAQPK